MLAKPNRVPRKIFDKVFREGRSVHSPHLRLKYFKMGSGLKRELGSPSRFSFSVPVKIAKGAVKRNLLRRRGYSIIRKYKDSIKGGYLTLFFFRKEAESISFQELEKEIVGLLKKAGIMGSQISN